jgi:hypothetical protein
MATQSARLIRLQLLIVMLTTFLLAFTVSGFVLLDVYLLSSVSASRLDSINRTRSYLQPSVTACIMLRNMHMARDAQEPVQLVTSYRASIASIAHKMITVNTLNFVEPPSQHVSDYLLDKSLQVIVPVPGHSRMSGSGVLQAQPTNFLGMINQFASSLLSASAIDLSDLQAIDYQVDQLSVNKRAVVFL